MQVPSGQSDYNSTATKNWDSNNAKARAEKMVQEYYNGRNLDIVVAACDSIAYGVIDGMALNQKCIRMIKAVVDGSKPDINDVKTYNNGVITVPAYLCIPKIIDKENIAEVK